MSPIIPHPSHATGVTSLPEDDQLIIGPHVPHFTNEILKEKGRKTKLKEYSLEESIRESPPALLITPPSPHPVTSVVFKMFSFLTMKYIPQTAF